MTSYSVANTAHVKSSGDLFAECRLSRGNQATNCCIEYLPKKQEIIKYAQLTHFLIRKFMMLPNTLTASQMSSLHNIQNYYTRFRLPCK